MDRQELRRQLGAYDVALPLNRTERLRRRWSRLRARSTWFTMTPAPSQQGDTVATMRMIFHVRRWHPGYWLFIGRAYWAALRGTRLSLYIKGRKVIPHG